MSKSGLLVSTAVGLTLAAGGPASALNGAHHNGMLKKRMNAQRLPGAPARPQRAVGPAQSGKLKEVFVIDTWSTDQVSLGSGFSSLESTTIKCKTDCTIIADGLLQEASYYSYNTIALCPAVDGYFMNGSCPFGAAFAPQHAPSGAYAPVPIMANISVGAGTHTAEFYVYTVAPAYLGGYQIDYHVYK